MCVTVYDFSETMPLRINFLPFVKKVIPLRGTASLFMHRCNLRTIAVGTEGSPGASGGCPHILKG
jgi:hypothetical protein